MDLFIPLDGGWHRMATTTRRNCVRATKRHQKFLSDSRPRTAVVPAEGHQNHDQASGLAFPISGSSCSTSAYACGYRESHPTSSCRKPILVNETAEFVAPS